MRLVHLLLGLILATSGLSVRAQESNTRPWWNPLGIGMGDTLSADNAPTAAPKTSRFFAGSEGAKKIFTMPKLPWQRPRSSSDTAEAPSKSVFRRMGDTTKGLWHSTVDFLNPFDKKQPPQQSLFDHQGYQPQLEREAKNKRGWLSWWRSEPAPEPTSVNEFLSLPRPGF
ncbi:MAG: hypothetical protein D6753_17550 [Planctomycetota bacterium]|nr:MAG: hypothetical protein D6753_17550 [Planctomycetota bacterium]